jgi:predicted deacetylase
MPLNDAVNALCVSIHDVAPQTWPQCAQLLSAIRAVAPIPVTLLVVPAYHRQPVADALAFDRLLEARLVQGDELALHGLTHLDEGPPPPNWSQKFVRQMYTTSEGEFSALDVAEASQRIEQGLGWFAQRQWPVTGFVAPAWLLGPGAWRALCQFPFRYTTTLRYFYTLPQPRALLSPSLVYAARNRSGRWLSSQRNILLAQLLAQRPLVRLGLHPKDAAYPQLVRHFQQLIEQLLVSRQALTKGGFGLRWQALSQEQKPSTMQDAV